ncbi:Lipoprotein signal peptidase [Candidatus Portiera aleyrodidarum]|uniref:Lipoprotein signal peptidase n=1 Tax=Candidatus Portiera aleyrodidarum TaxID=91844 RepID=A0A6S6S575_9GAMM|nr:signal peptidase II [Candidatus Portiera aleyrodidarum]CAA3704905.1 Lipoprotein signal peptidase [Candidatus Portiera aleyrodidarum]
MMDVRLIFTIISFDFSTKLIVNNWLNIGNIKIINKNLNLTLLHNYYGLEITNSFFFVIVLVILGKRGLELIIGGTVGNIIDKVGNGYIIDFLSFHLLDKYYLVLNIADLSIIIGCFISLI